MQRKISVLLILALIIAFCAPCLSSCAGRKPEFRYGAYKYTVENREVTITKYNGNAKNVRIPKRIAGMPVVAVGDSAFENRERLRSVTIPDSVVKIDGSAFYECQALESVTLGSGIREMPYSPFHSCDKVVYNKYEDGHYIGNDENPYLVLIAVGPQNVETFTIHPDTVVICGSAMRNCSLLRELVFPEGVVSIGMSAMSFCSSLEKVYIPKSVEIINKSFYNCNSICEIIVDEENPTFKSVNGSLFSRDGTRLIKYAAGQNLESYHIPDGTVIIEDYAFDSAKHLKEVLMPDSVEEIGHQAFLRCENMYSINLVNGLKKIGGQAFGMCSSLKHITIPDNIEELSYSLFSSCERLESVVIGSGVVRIEDEVFSGCKSLKDVTFRDPVDWEVKRAYALFADGVDVSDPKQNVAYLTGEYCRYYWYKE